MKNNFVKSTKKETILYEMKEHLPFTLIVSFVAGILVAISYSFGRVPSEELFELVHPAHLVFSAIATSAIYWKYKKPSAGERLAVSGWRRGGETILVGVSGAILVGSLSDVFLPFLAGRLLSLETIFHLPLIEEPVLILGSAFIGAVLGMYFNLFRVSHMLHVFLSVFASLFYLLAFSVEMSAGVILLISGLVFLVVYIPCCISDIVFPLLFMNRPCEDCGHWHQKNH